MSGAVYGGVDVGASATKVVIVDANGIIKGKAISLSRMDFVSASKEAFAAALRNADASEDDVVYTVSSGYGRKNVDFSNQTKTEIACHARGAFFYFKEAMSIIDIGGQDCKAMKIDDTGKVVKFVTNDKCASGTGRFLEVMASVLGIEIDELGMLSKKAKEPVILASTCTVWAQADVIKYLNSDYAVEDIGAGINTAMANRIAILANTIKAEKDISMTGGVAKNKGVVATLSKVIGHKIKIARKADPQLAGAIGAALFAKELVETKQGGTK